MASGQPNPDEMVEVYQRTRKTLGKTIKKPPLNDKLLARPPFKFLRDILFEVSKTTDFFKGLYSDKELDTKTEWDRDMKTKFLQKAIDVVVFTTGKSLKARPSKIIAGAEADRTNEFLQMLGLAILKKLDSSEAIQKVLKGEKPSQQSDKEKQKEAKKPKKDSEPDKKSKELSVQEETKENLTVPATQPLGERPLNRPSTRRKTRNASKAADDEPSESLPRDKVDDGLASEGSNGSQIKLPERPTSAKGGRKTAQDGEGSSPSLEKGLEEPSQLIESTTGQQSPPPPSSSTVPNGLISSVNTRPSSARPPAPRVVSRVTDNDEAQSRLSSGHDRVPPNVILDKEEEGEEDEEFVMQNSNFPTLQETNLVNGHSGDSKPEGALAKTLLEAKERFVGEEGMASDRDASAKDTTIDEAQRKREREGVEKEVKTLQQSIQSLCQSANPLGKMMDYVQEDLDSMYQELEMWRKENTSHAEALRREEKITEDELAPLQSQLTELEERVVEQLDLISSMKIGIMKNEQQMKNLIMSSH